MLRKFCKKNVFVQKCDEIRKFDDTQLMDIGGGRCILGGSELTQYVAASYVTVMCDEIR